MPHNPAIIECQKNQWTKVVTAQISGIIHILDNSPSEYFHTYRLTEGSAPTNLTEAVEFTEALEILSPVSIDVYVYAKDEIGIVRVDV